MSHAGPRERVLRTELTEHEGFLRSRLIGLGVPADAVEDAMQDVFEVLVRRIDVYDERRSFRRWMAGVARKVARRHRERRQRAPVPLPEEPKAPAATDPERAAVTREAHARLDAFLAELHPDQWAVFVLSEIEGLRGTEIAAELDVNLSTVYARLRTARRAFDRALGPDERRWLPAWLAPLTRSESPSGGLALAGTSVMAGLVMATALGVAARAQCAAERDDASAGPTVVDASRPSMPGIAHRPADPAGLVGTGHDDAPPLPDPDGWIPAGSGLTHQGDGVLSHEFDYRLSGELVEFRVTYVGDDDATMTVQMHELTVDGMVLLEGLPQEPVVVPAGETHVFVLRLRAVREGRVSFRLGMGTGWTMGYAGEQFVFSADEGLRRCGDRECVVTLDHGAIAERLSGEPIEVELVNTCETDVRYALLPGADFEPPADYTTHVIPPGDRRTLTIDRALWFRRVADDGTVSGGAVHTDEDGATVELYAIGSECGWRVMSSGLGWQDLPSVP